MIFSISLSKLGLPGLRTSVVVADAPVVHALRNMNAIVSLANGNLGQAMLMPFLADDRLIRLGREVIRPFYQKRSEFTRQVLADSLGDSVPWAVHSLEGAFFLWLWLKDSPVPSGELYQRLKARKVLAGVRGDLYAGDGFADFRRLLADFEPERPERLTDPMFRATDPEELLIDEVEAIWAPISERDDWALFEAKLARLERAREAWALV